MNYISFILFYFCIIKLTASSVYHYSISDYELSNSEIHFNVEYVTELYNRMECERWSEPHILRLYNKTIVSKHDPDEIESLSYVYKDDHKKHIVLYVSTPIIDKMEDIGECNVTIKINKYNEDKACYYYNYLNVFSNYKNDIPIVLNKLSEMYPNYKLVFFGKSPLLHLLTFEINKKYDLYVDYFYWFYPSQYFNKIGNSMFEKMISDVIRYKYAILQTKDNDIQLEYTFYKFMNVNIQYNTTYKFCGFHKNKCVEKLYNLNTYCI